MSDVGTARSDSIRPVLTVLALLLVLLLVLRFALKIDVVYVLSGGVPWMLGVEGAVVGFGVGWLLEPRQHPSSQDGAGACRHRALGHDGTGGSGHGRHLLLAQLGRGRAERR